MFTKVRLFVVLLSILSTLNLSFADTFTLPTCDIQVTIPEGWVYLTQDEKVLAEKAEAFGQTPESAMAFLSENGYQIYLYNEESHAQLYIAVLDSPYAESMGAISDMSGEHRQLLYDLLLGNYPGWTNDSGMGVYVSRDMTYLTTTMHYGSEDNRTDDRQLFTFWGSKAVYIDLYVPHAYMTEQLVSEENQFVDSIVYNISARQAAGKVQVYKFGMIFMLYQFGIIAIGLAMVAFLRFRKLA